jgi:hypothetical protein
VIRTLGLDLVGGTPAEFGKFQQQEIAKWSGVVNTANIKME